MNDDEINIKNLAFLKMAWDIASLRQIFIAEWQDYNLQLLRVMR